MPTPIEQLAREVIDGQRRAIARAITLVESARLEDAPAARALLEALAPHTGRSRRIGVSGVPGVGKSSFLEALGTRLVARGHRVAVLAIDPSSALSGGSILGDKTRMGRLSREPAAFIRPTAGAGHLGGVGARTREAIAVCEAAGFDVVFVETIGVGQSEAAVRDLVDTFVLLMLAGAGDELQGIKRGILEVADVALVTKADGDNAAPAASAAAELRGALQILRPHTAPAVATCSAFEGSGIEGAWEEIVRRHDAAAATGALRERRRAQDVLWFERRLDELLRARFIGANQDALHEAREAVRTGVELPVSAALRLAELRAE